MQDPTHIAPVIFNLEKVECRYGKLKALTSTTLSIRRGERVAIVGPSGSGKTTLLRLCNASLQANSGTIEILGKHADNLPPRHLRMIRSRIATIPQDLGLVPNLRVWQNIVTGKIGKMGLIGNLRNLLAPSRSTMAEMHTLLERVGIEEKLFARTAELSGGQQQRVAVARALFQEPEAILADEPVSSVDPARAASLVELLNDIAVEHGLTLMMSLHNLELARTAFPRLIGLRGGRLHFDQSPDQLNPASLEKLYHLDPDEILADG